MSEKKKPVPAKDETVHIKIPKALLQRVEAYCQVNGITPLEFLIDAVNEKLAFVHREKRRKPRL